MAPASKADERDERSESSNLSLSVEIGAAKAPQSPPGRHSPAHWRTRAVSGRRCARRLGIVASAAALDLAGYFDDDFAEVFVGFHVGVGFGHAVERIDGVDFGSEFAAFEHRE